MANELERWQKMLKYLYDIRGGFAAASRQIRERILASPVGSYVLTVQVPAIEDDEIAGPFEIW